MEITESFKIPDYSGCRVYAIINILDFKAYVGSSRNIKRRTYRHFQDLKEGKHYIDDLQKDSRRGLRFVILDKYDNIDKDKLRIAEYVFMVKMLDQHFDLYNINPFKGVEDKRNQLYHIIASETIYEYYGVAEKAIKEEFGTYPWFVCRRTDENKRKLLENSGA